MQLTIYSAEAALYTASVFEVDSPVGWANRISGTLGAEEGHNRLSSRHWWRAVTPIRHLLTRCGRRQKQPQQQQQHCCCLAAARWQVPCVWKMSVCAVSLWQQVVKVLQEGAQQPGTSASTSSSEDEAVHDSIRALVHSLQNLPPQPEAVWQKLVEQEKVSSLPSIASWKSIEQGAFSIDMCTSVGWPGMD